MKPTQSPGSTQSSTPKISTPTLVEPKQSSPDTDLDKQFKALITKMGIKPGESEYQKLLAQPKEVKMKMIASDSQKKDLKKDTPLGVPTRGTITPTKVQPVSTSPVKAPVVQSTVKPSSGGDTNIDQQFKQLLESLKVKSGDAKYTSYMALPSDKKAMMIQTHSTNKPVTHSVDGDSPQRFISELKKDKVFPFNVKSTMLALKSASPKWITDFVKLGGISCITALLANTNVMSRKGFFENLLGTTKPKKRADDEMQYNCVELIQALINTEIGMDAFLGERDAIRTMILLLDVSGPKTRIMIMLDLAVIVQYSDDGLNLVLDAFNHYKLVRREKFRFSDLIASLDEKDPEYLLHVVMLFNAILSSVEDTAHKTVKQEFMNLNLHEKLKHVKKEVLESEFADRMLTQYDIFLEFYSSDLSLPGNNVSELVASLNVQLPGDSQVVLLKIIRGLFSTIAEDSKITSENWKILEKLIEQVISNRGENRALKNFMHEYNKIKAVAKNQESVISDYEKKLKNPQSTQVVNSGISEEAMKIEIGLFKTFLGDLKDGKDPTDVKLSILSELIPLVVDLSKNISKSSVTTHSEKPQQSVVESIIPVDQQPLVTVSAPQIVTAPTGPPQPPPPNGPTALNVPIVTPPTAPHHLPTSGGPPPPGPPGPPTAPGVPRVPGPPSIGGGAPPGPPGAPSIDDRLPKLAKFAPTTKLRGVVVEQITKKKVLDSIFVTENLCEATTKLSLPTKEMEDLFNREIKTVKLALPTNAKPQLKSLLDPKRSYNLAIQLGSIRMKYDELKKEILAMNEKVLTQSMLTTIKDMVPREDEVDMYNTSEDDPSTLSEPDKFMIALKDIPLVYQRMESWVFKMKCESDISIARGDVETLLRAVHEMKTSGQFKELLTVVLGIINYLNSGGPKKDTFGFKLASLNKLRETKTTDNQSNLLEFLITYVNKDHKNASEWINSLQSVPLARRTALSSIKDTVSMLKQGVVGLKRQIETSQSTKIDGDNFLTAMVPFASQVEDHLRVLTEKSAKLEKELAELSVLYDEDKATLTQKPEEFFEMINNFIHSWKDAITQMEARNEKKKKAEALSLKQSQQKELQSQVVKESSSRGVSKGLVDQLSDTMKDKNAYEQRRNMRKSVLVTSSKPK